jgi:tetratricopeptide (TPR) repeat protein
MIVVLFFALLSEPELDRIADQLGSYPPLESIISINRQYLHYDAFNKAINLLQKYENTYQGVSQAKIEFALAENYFFASRIIDARNKYLNMAQRHPASLEANNALERLYQIEGMRADTVVMKKILYALCLLATYRFDACIDSLTRLTNSKIGDRVYYFLASAYRQRSDLPMALGALLSIKEQFPNSRIYELPVLEAELYIDSKAYDKARMILENFLVKDPISIYGVKARQLLEKIPE